MSNLSPASILYDDTGNPVGVVLDGSVYRLQVEAKIVGSTLPTGAATEATLAALETKAATETTLAALETKAATETTLAALETKAATETTLAALETKAATETTLASADSTLTAISDKVATEVTSERLALFAQDHLSLLSTIRQELCKLNCYMAIITNEDDPI